MRVVLMCLVLLIPVGMAGYAYRLAGRRSVGQAVPTRSGANHLAMARWMDRELVVGMIDADQRATAERLLREFYGSDNYQGEIER